MSEKKGKSGKSTGRHLRVANWKARQQTVPEDERARMYAMVKQRWPDVVPRYTPRVKSLRPQRRAQW